MGFVSLVGGYLQPRSVAHLDQLRDITVISSWLCWIDRILLAL
jgi:hypothetical protein